MKEMTSTDELLAHAVQITYDRGLVA